MTVEVRLTDIHGVREAVQRRDVVIIVDVLRCSSTIVTALANGALGIIPTLTVEEAKRLHEENPEFILAGEREGLPPQGFQMGNSPGEFTPDAVDGRYVILTTTAGTRALIRAADAPEVFVGSLLNARAAATAAVKAAENSGAGISIVTAGTGDGFHFSLEDYLCAGLLAWRMRGCGVQYEDRAYAALLAFRGAEKNLLSHIKMAEHAKYLISIGLTRDVEFCSQVDITDVVPRLRMNSRFPYGVVEAHRRGTHPLINNQRRQL